MGEEPERLRADVQELARVIRLAESSVQTVMRRKLGSLDALLAEVERLARRETQLSGWYNEAERKITELKAQVERLAGELKEESRLVETAWRQRDEETEKAMRAEGRARTAAGERDDWIAKYERLAKLADELAGRVAALELRGREAIGTWGANVVDVAGHSAAIEEFARALADVGGSE